MTRRETLTRALAGVRSALDVYEEALATARAEAFIRPLVWLGTPASARGIVVWSVMVGPPAVSIGWGRGPFWSVLAWGLVLAVGWLAQAWFRPLHWVALSDQMVDELYDEIAYASTELEDLREQGFEVDMPPKVLLRSAFLRLGRVLAGIEIVLRDEIGDDEDADEDEAEE